jgi:hypothetical protein
MKVRLPAGNSGVEFGSRLASNEASSIDAAAALGTTHTAFGPFDAWTDADDFADTHVEDDVGGGRSLSRREQEALLYQ